jgi:HAE1 family hydrophobic/amphiphilic exporter-1
MIDFFIKRPIFAGVIAIITVFVGLLTLAFLPLAQFPNIVPPQIQINTQYLGASSQVVSDAVTTPIELAINGVHGLHSMISSSNNLGYTLINANFDFDENVNIASTDVFTNISNTTAKLPAPVNQNGITVQKVSKNMVLVVNLIDKKHVYDSHFLGNYADINIVPVLKRITGVGDVKNYGLLQYAIRVWLDPNKMASLNLSPEDVVSAIKDQNQQAALGIFSRPPTQKELPIQIQITTEEQLKDPNRYADIVVKVEKDGNLVKLKDLGRVELGSQNYDSSTNFDMQPTASVGVYQYPNSNAVNIAKQVYATMETLKKQFPPGVEYVFAYDTTEFIKESLKEVLVTLLEAMALVFMVVYLFLQRFRTTLIPCIAIPVSLIGTFIFFAIFHFSINTLSLLGLVLAIGLVVDDAIVVVENVERKLEEGMQDIKEATLLATEEVKSPIIATTLILLAVFVPVAFIPGISGMLYNQFALAIAFSVALSGINSLSLSPALCGILLGEHQAHQRSWFFQKFEEKFQALKLAYARALDQVMHHRSKVLLVFGLSLIILVWGFVKIPKTFLPDEDQGYLIIQVKKPDGYNIYAINEIFNKIYPLNLNLKY